MFKFFFSIFLWHSVHEFEPQIPDEFKQIASPSWAEFELIINQTLLMINNQQSTFNFQLRSQHTTITRMWARLPTSMLADDDNSDLSTTPPSRVAATQCPSAPPLLRGMWADYWHPCSPMTMTQTTTTTPPTTMIDNEGDNQQDNRYQKPPTTCDGDSESPR